MTKVCTKCAIEKPLTEYHKFRNGFRPTCKACRKVEASARYLEKKDHILAVGASYYRNNSESAKIRTKQYRENHPGAATIRMRNWRAANRDHHRATERAWKADQRINNPMFKLKNNMRRRIAAAFQGIGWQKSAKTEELLGCTFEQFQNHLISKFQPGMTLQNHGFGNNKWHIDHIIPLDAANGDPARLVELFHYNNTQPLWQDQNLSKGANQSLDAQENT